MKSRSSGATRRGRSAASAAGEHSRLCARRFGSKAMHGCERKSSSRYQMKRPQRLRTGQCSLPAPECEPMATSLQAQFLDHVCQTSPDPLGLEIVEAHGATLTAAGGERYIDLIAGIAVNNLGHTHPAVVEAIREQSGRYLHAMVYGEYVLEPQVRLAALLAELTPPPLSVTYFMNSGTEAVEGALKLAKKWTGRRGLVAFENSYHGD